MDTSVRAGFSVEWERLATLATLPVSSDGLEGGPEMPAHTSIVLAPGDRYGRLAIIREVERQGKYNRRFECQCDCGNAIVARMADLRSHNTESCGCLHRERTSAARGWHDGEVGTVEYTAWRGMIQRCYDQNLPDYHNWGGRGIKVCDEWRFDYHAFLAHIGRKPSPDLTLDRWPDNDGDYRPGNVRWATRKQQRANQRPRRAA